MPGRRTKTDRAGRQRKRFRTFGPPNSLFGEILDWMLAPLLFLWPISILVTHSVAGHIANEPYDRILADNVRALARLIRIEGEHIFVDFPASPRLLFRSDQDDVLYYQVAWADGRLVSGDSEIDWVVPLGKISDSVQFRDDFIHSEEVRIAYQFVGSLPGKADGALVQIAETRNKRKELAFHVVTGVLLPQFAIIPLAIVLVWMGLTRGIAPLNRLQSLIRSRRPTDLSPIGPDSVPDEVRPLIVSFNEMMTRLEENQQAQQRFIADAAHQMRTPLTGLKMQTELALQERDSEQLRLLLLNIDESTDRASHLINQLLSLARAESSSEKVYAIAQVDLGKIVRVVAQDLFPSARTRNIDLGVEVDDAFLPIKANAVLLQEMIKNLVDNAIKYTPAGGSVTVRIRQGEGAIFLEVEDSGIGIDAADCDRVFERFYRVLDSGGDGSGLGLAIVREIAELHRAQVTLKPNPAGQGTVAEVVFYQ